VWQGLRLHRHSRHFAAFVGNSTFRANGIAAGLPANFFVANPDVLGFKVRGSNPAP
jgi:hypothetical protein